jgi:hypothetical protein
MIAALIVTGIGLAVFVSETAGVSSAPGPTRLELRILDAADDLNSGAGVAIAKVVTLLGTVPFTAALAVIGAIALVRAGRAAEAVGLVASAVAIYIAVHVTKAATDRPARRAGRRVRSRTRPCPPSRAATPPTRRSTSPWRSPPAGWRSSCSPSSSPSRSAPRACTCVSIGSKTS